MLLQAKLGIKIIQPRNLEIELSTQHSETGFLCLLFLVLLYPALLSFDLEIEIEYKQYNLKISSYHDYCP
jgi:hypothetical protein